MGFNFSRLFSGAGQGGGYSGQDAVGWQSFSPSDAYQWPSMVNNVSKQLRDLGYSGDILTTQPSIYGGGGESGNETSYETKVSPELQAWIDANGYGLKFRYVGSDAQTAIAGRDGKILGIDHYNSDDGGPLETIVPLVLGGIATAGVASALGAGAAGTAGAASSLTGPGALDAYAAMDAGYGAAGAAGVSGLEAAGGAAGLATSAPAYGGVGTAGAGAGSDAVLTGYGGAGGLSSGGLLGQLGPVGDAIKGAAGWMKENPLLGRLLMSGATGLLSAAGGGGSGGAPMQDYGPAKQWTSPLQQGLIGAPRQVQPQGLLASGHASDGAWRYMRGK